MILIISYMVILSFLSLVLVRKHLFMCLLNLEYLVIYVLFMIMLVFMFYYSCMYMYVLFMVIYVCEGALGLSLLVYVVRFHGNDYLNSILMW